MAVFLVFFQYLALLGSLELMKKYTLYDIQYSGALLKIRDTMRGRSFFNIHVLRDLQGSPNICILTKYCLVTI